MPGFLGTSLSDSHESSCDKNSAHILTSEEVSQKIEDFIDTRVSELLKQAASAICEISYTKPEAYVRIWPDDYGQITEKVTSALEQKG